MTNETRDPMPPLPWWALGFLISGCIYALASTCIQDDHMRRIEALEAPHVDR